MNKRTRNIIWASIALVLNMFAGLLIKNDNISYVVNIMGDLIFVKLLMKWSIGRGNKKTLFWQTLAIAAFLFDALIRLILLSI